MSTETPRQHAGQPERDRTSEVAVAMCPDAFSTTSRGLATSAPNAMRVGMLFDFAETLLEGHTVAPMNEAALREALTAAEGWAEHSSKDTGRAYYEGMRDTLRVVLGITTERPRVTGPGSDVAAELILGAQQRQASTKKASTR